MKKILIAAAMAIAMAQGVWAQEINVVGASAYNGYSVCGIYFSGYYEDLDQTAKNDFDYYFLDQTAWSETGAQSWEQHYETMSSWGLGGVKISDGVATFDDGYPGASGYQSGSFYLFKDGLVPNGSYILLTTAHDTTGTNTFSLDGLAAISSGTLKGGAPGPEPVPEPTSGLLMLLGVAGLALKRKQK